MEIRIAGHSHSRIVPFFFVGTLSSLKRQTGTEEDTRPGSSRSGGSWCRAGNAPVHTAIDQASPSRSSLRIIAGRAGFHWQWQSPSSGVAPGVGALDTTGTIGQLQIRREEAGALADEVSASIIVPMHAPSWVT